MIIGSKARRARLAREMEEATSPKEYQLPRASIIRRPISRRSVGAIVASLMLLAGGVSWKLFHGADIELDIATGTARRPIVVVGGKVEQMPAGDYLAANTLVDTTGCSSTNVIAWNGSQFACAAAGGGGGGITNSAGANVVMKSNGTNAVASSITDDGTTVGVAGTNLTVTESNGAATSTNWLQSYSGAVSLENGFVNFGYNTNAAATGYLNRTGFHAGTANFRDLEVDDGKGASIAHFTGSTKSADFPAGELTFNTSRVKLSAINPSYFRGDNPNTSNIGNVGFGGNAASSSASPVDIQSSYTGLHNQTVSGGAEHPNTMLNMFTADFYDMSAATSDVLMTGMYVNRGGDESPTGAHIMTIVTADFVPGSATAHYLVSTRTEDFVGQSIGTVEQHAGHVHRHTKLPVTTTCGTGGTVSGDDVQGAEVVGTGTVTSCAITFVEPWKQETETSCPGASCSIVVASVVPNCTVTSRTGVVLSYTPTATTLTVTATSLTSTTFDWHCEAPN